MKVILEQDVASAMMTHIANKGLDIEGLGVVLGTTKKGAAKVSIDIPKGQAKDVMAKLDFNKFMNAMTEPEKGAVQ